MSEFEARSPDYKGSGISVWVDKDKDGKPLLKIKKDEWAKTLVAFKFEPKAIPQEEIKL